MKPLASIQALRALAALGVLLFHAVQWSGAKGGMALPVGAAGVDVFFMVSGFVLWRSAAREDPAPIAFLAARAARILPLYWLATLAAAAIAWRWPALLPVVYPEPRHLLLSLALWPHVDPAGGPFPLLPVGWTLVYEAVFYLVFAAALAAAPAHRWRILAGGLATAALLGFAYHGWYTLWANPLLLQFLAGAALGRAWRPERHGDASLVGLAALAAGAGLLAAQQALGWLDDFWRPLLFGLPAFLMTWGALRLEGALSRRPGVSKLFGRLGDASYALYLVHLPVVTAVAALTPTWPAGLRIGVAALAALALALGVHAAIEAPLTAALRRGLARPWRPARSGLNQEVGA